MVDRAELLAEAFQRGLLKGPQKEMYAEAVRRGIIAAPDHVKLLARAGEDVTTPAAAEPLRQFARQATLGLSEAAPAAIFAGSQALRGKASFGDAYDAARRVEREETADRESPLNTAAGVAGGVASMLTGAGEARLLTKGVPLAAKLARGAKVGALVGGVGGAANADRLRDIPRDAATGTLSGAALGATTEGALAGASRLGRGATKNLRSPDVKLLASEGVHMTPGQMLGGAAKTAEEAARSTPISGDAITAAHRRGLETFNRAAVQRSLTPLGKRLPADVGAGHDAIAHAGDVLGSAYDRLLPKAGVTADAELKRIGKALAPEIETLTPESRQRLETIIASRVTSRFTGGKIDGETYQRIQSELKAEAGRYSASLDPDHRAMAQALKTVSGELQSAAGRQNPGFSQELRKIDTGYAHLTLAERAASKAGAEGGVFTPKMYASAVRAANSTVRKRGVARGEALGQDLATAGERVLSQKLPDSGTARRLAGGGVGHLVGGIAGGGGLFAVGGVPGVLAGAATVAAGAAGGAAAYSRPAQEALNAALVRRLTADGGPGALALHRNFLPVLAGRVAIGDNQNNPATN